MASQRPSSRPLTVIVLDADPGQRRTLTGLIAQSAEGRFDARGYATAGEALAALSGAPDAVMIADIETIGGPHRVADVAAVPLIATSAHASLSTAVAAVKGGAVDFLPKPIGAKTLIERLEAAVQTWHVPRPAAPAAKSKPRPTTDTSLGTDFASFIGRSPAMLQVYDEIQRMAPSRAPVFVTGESGTGKELTAEAIHAHAGGRAERPFVAINCSAIPKDLMESEIFGHTRGAFTGATEDRPGAAERADGGTLFLDEIAEMELGLQAKILRFLQSGTVQRVGGGDVKHVDVRVVCATNRDPFAEVAAGRFRADLFYRLHVLPIHLPPLRERRDDIAALAETFLRRYAEEEGRAFRGYTQPALDCLVAYPWPGNVRQLANVVRRIVVLNDAAEVTLAMLPDAVARPGTRVGDEAALTQTHGATLGPLWQMERQIIEFALAAHGGNIARAAAALEISPSTIYRKRQSWEERSRLAS